MKKKSHKVERIVILAMCEDGKVGRINASGEFDYSDPGKIKIKKAE